MSEPNARPKCGYTRVLWRNRFSVLIGAGFACVGWLLVSNVRPAPLDELALIQQARTASGTLVENWEDIVADDDHGRPSWMHGWTLRFNLATGRQVEFQESDDGRARAAIGEPVPVTVEYLPDRPGIHRVRGEGNRSVVEWVLRRILVGAILLCLAGGAGIWVICDAWKRVEH